MDHTSYIAKSRASLEALKSANLLKSLNINALIFGEEGTGKKTLAKFILPKAKIVDAENFKELLLAISSNSAIIITNFDKVLNFNLLKSTIEENETRIIATSKNELTEKISSEFFSLTITIPPLHERSEDIEPLTHKFFDEISSVMNDNKDISLKDLNIDLSTNCISLRKAVFTRYMMSSLGEDEVMQVIEEFLSKKLGGNNDYRELLYLFDVPMIRCGFKKFNSQLNMSEKFGLNRNTLRKKINDNKNNYKLQ